MAKAPKMTDWSRSKPPGVGEWNASTVKDQSARRWWNGKYWSVVYYPQQPEVAQRTRRRLKANESQGSIYWRGLAEQPHYPFPPGPLEAL